MKIITLFVLLLLPILVLSQYDGMNVDEIDGFSSFETVDSSRASGEWEYGMKGMFGFVTIDNESYTQIRLMPEIVFGKFGLGLDIDLLIDSDGAIRSEDWDEWQDYFNKLLYLRYGDREDPIYFKFGSIRDYTLARGLIFNRYSNMLLYPSVRNLGGFVGINSSILGLGGEIYTHNVHKNEIVAGRIHAKPLEFTNIPMIEDFKIGFNVGYDRNVYAKYEDSDDDGRPDVYDKFPEDSRIWLDTDNNGIPDYPFDPADAHTDVVYDIDISGQGGIDHPNSNPYVDIVLPGIVTNYPHFQYNTGFTRDYATDTSNKKDILVYSVDYILPVIDNKVLYLYNYGELAQINNYGQGLIFPGFGADFSIFNTLLEFRQFGDRFKPGFFDGIYDDERCQVSYEFHEEFQVGNETYENVNVYSLVGKENILDAFRSSWGWYGSIQANILEMLYLKISYQDMYGENVRTGKSLWAGLKVMQDYIPHLIEAYVAYSQRNVDYIDFGHLRNIGAQIDGRLTYAISPNAHLVGKFAQRYVDVNNNGDIKGKDEVINTVTFGVEFRFE